MDTKEIKKVLAGVGIAGLLSGAGVGLTSGPAFGGSGCGGGSGCSGAMKGAKGGAMKMEAPAAKPGAAATEAEKGAATTLEKAAQEESADRTKSTAMEGEKPVAEKPADFLKKALQKKAQEKAAGGK